MKCQSMFVVLFLIFINFEYVNAQSKTTWRWRKEYSGSTKLSSAGVKKVKECVKKGFNDNQIKTSLIIENHFDFECQRFLVNCDAPMVTDLSKKFKKCTSKNNDICNCPTYPGEIPSTILDKLIKDAKK